jgi:hypothetical protein
LILLHDLLAVLIVLIVLSVAVIVVSDDLIQLVADFDEM